VNQAYPLHSAALISRHVDRQRLGDAEKIAARTREYEDRFLSPFVAAERGYIDEVITPRATRRRLARALGMLRGKKAEMPQRKHDNLPV
jgi:propionyl-CoA carboxylase beta chain